jgi:hypothetical protein
MARKDKKAKGKPDWPEVSLAQNPAAKRSIAKLKAGSGLVAFVVVAWFSYAAGVDTFEVGVRALGAGMAAYLAGWAFGIALWKRLLIHQAKMTVKRRQEELLARIEAASGESEDEAAA